jgi:hypothetical protein
MLLKINEYYQLLFNSAFAALNGIYRITGVLTYQQFLDSDIELFEQLYEPVARTEDELDEDMINYVNDLFYTMVNANNNAVLCAPTSIILANNPDVKQYYGTMLTVNLGMFEDPELVYPIADVVLNTLRDRLGNPGQTEEAIQNAEALNQLADFRANIQVYIREWLVSSEYLDTVKRRKLARDRAEELGGKSHANYCTMYLNTLAELRETRERLRITEEKLIELMETPS